MGEGLEKTMGISSWQIVQYRKQHNETTRPEPPSSSPISSLYARPPLLSIHSFSVYSTHAYRSPVMCHVLLQTLVFISEDNRQRSLLLWRLYSSTEVGERAGRYWRKYTVEIIDKYIACCVQWKEVFWGEKDSERSGRLGVPGWGSQSSLRCQDKPFQGRWDWANIWRWGSHLRSPEETPCSAVFGGNISPLGWTWDGWWRRWIRPEGTVIVNSSTEIGTFASEFPGRGSQILAAPTWREP